MLLFFFSFFLHPCSLLLRCVNKMTAESWSNWVLHQLPLPSFFSFTQTQTASFNSTFLYFLYFFFVCQTEDCRPAVWRHLIPCLFLCWAPADKLSIVLTLIEAPCMLDMYGLLFYPCPLTPDSSMTSHTASLFWDSIKKVTGHHSPPHPPPTYWNGISAVLKCTWGCSQCGSTLAGLLEPGPLVFCLTPPVI